jgi:DNA-directed RNA polymerase subunit RPC12/RpoP
MRCSLHPRYRHRPRGLVGTAVQPGVEFLAPALRHGVFCKVPVWQLHRIAETPWAIERPLQDGNTLGFGTEFALAIEHPQQCRRWHCLRVFVMRSDSMAAENGGTLSLFRSSTFFVRWPTVVGPCTMSSTLGMLGGFLDHRRGCCMTKKKRDKKPRCPECGSTVVRLLAVKYDWETEPADTGRAKSAQRTWLCSKCGRQFNIADPF